MGVGVVYDAIESEVELGVTVEWSDGVLKTETKKSDESFIPKKKLSSQPFKEKRKGKAKTFIRFNGLVIRKPHENQKRILGTGYW